MKRSSTAYICTFDAQSAADMQHLEEIRKTIRVANRQSVSQNRVVVRGRKPFEKELIRNRYTGKTSELSYDWAGNIVGGLANASKLDVYVYPR